MLFSDGITEAMDPELKEFGLVRLREVLAGCAGASLDELQAAILAAVKVFTRGADQADDLTLLLVRYQGAAQTATALAGGR